MTLPFDSVPHEAHGAETQHFDAICDQLHQTLLEMVNATLARLRRGEAPAPRLPAVRLSSREQEVLQRLAAGDSNKAIARTLDLSPHTVKRHVANILDKLGVQTRGQAAAWWLTRH